MQPVPQDLLKEYVQSQHFTSTADIMAAMKDMFRDVIQQVMEVEMDEELGRERCQRAANPGSYTSPNYRNGYSQKTVKTQLGEIDIKVPRDRKGNYEPKIISKYDRNAEGMEDKILSLYACGMSQHHMPHSTILGHYAVVLNKNYQVVNGKELITTPKTPKSKRKIKMPQFLCDELKEYMTLCYKVKPDDRLFPVTKSFLHRMMKKGCLLQELPKIRLHDLRHSHVSLLINMGFDAVAIASRMGHESIDITFRYAHLFPSVQTEMAAQLDEIRKGDPYVC